MVRVACIGRRDIPERSVLFIEQIGEYIAGMGGCVVTGNAIGSDASFAAGANKQDSTKVKLFMPWPSYNSEFIVAGNEVITEHEDEWSGLAARHHPAYEKLTQGVRKLMDRNAGIILNSDITIAVLNHEKKDGGGTAHGFRASLSLKHPSMDISAMVGDLNGMKEVVKWLEFFFLKDSGNFVS